MPWPSPSCAGASERSQQRSLRARLQPEGPEGLSPPQAPGLSRNGRAASAVAAASLHCTAPARSRHHKMSPAPFARRPPKAPRRAAFLSGTRGQPTPRGPPGPSGMLWPCRLIPCNIGGDQTASQTQHLPVSMETPSCSIPLSDQRWTTGCCGCSAQGNRASPRSPGPELLPGWESFVLKVFIHPETCNPDFLDQK